MARIRVMIGLAVAVAALALLRPPSASLRILAHDPGDLAPHRVEAAIDLGLMALSLIVTWSGRQLR